MKKLISAAGAVILAGGIVVGGAALTASAHDKTAAITCTSWSVSLTNYDTTATAQVTLDGAVIQTGTFGGAYVHTGVLTSDAKHTSHELAVAVVSKDGEQYNFTFDQTATGCYTPPVNPTPTPTPTVPPVVAVACVLSAAPWAPESGDLGPIALVGGLQFAGAHTQAVDYYQRVTAGNAQGITALTVTYGPGGTGQPAQVVIEINPHTTVTYATLSTNLVAPSGTVNVLAPTVLWSTTKIPTGPGSLAQPIPYAALLALFPANTLLSAPSLHLLTHSTAGDVSLVTGISSSCGSTSFVTVATPAPTVAPPVQLPTVSNVSANQLAHTGVGLWLLYPGLGLLLAGMILAAISLVRRRRAAE